MTDVLRSALLALGGGLFLHFRLIAIGSVRAMEEDLLSPPAPLDLCVWLDICECEVVVPQDLVLWHIIHPIGK
jgi:hypothetical protein